MVGLYRFALPFSPQKKSCHHDLADGLMDRGSGLEFTNTFNLGHVPPVKIFSFIQSFSKALVEGSYIFINMNNSLLMNSWEHEIDRAPWSVPK